VAPDGTTTADRVYFDTTGGTASVLGQSIAGAIGYTFSIYLKSNTGTNQTIYLRSDSAPITGTTITATNTWQRFTFTAPTWASTTRDIGLDLRSTLAATSDLLVWGAQWEASDIATDYIATTSAAVSVGPVSGLPRLDYLNSSCPRLLLEPQRTNLLTFSEQMNNAAYGKGDGIAIEANATTSPDGYTSADKIYTNTTVGGDHYFNRTPFTSISSSTAYTFSIFAKKAEFKYISVESTIENNNYKSVTVDLSNGNISNNNYAQTPKVEDYGNGWYRISVFGTSGAAQTSTDTYIIVLNNSQQRFYTGNGVDGIYTWGWQLEAGAYATSYIPTLGTSVTRVADAASKTGISSLIGQTEGTLFAEIVYNGNASATSNIIHANNNSTSSVFILRRVNGNIEAAAAVGGVAVGQVIGGNMVAGSTFKIAYAYKSGSSALYINGVQIGTSAQAFAFTQSVSEIRLNDPTTFFSIQQNVSFDQALLFKTRLTNDQLAELTA
jgi:hypothetical protein